MNKRRRVRGHVAQVRVHEGSRHEHMSLVLRVGRSQLELRSPDKSAFEQADFEPYVGCEVEVEGYEIGGRLIFVENLERIDTTRNSHSPEEAS